MAGSFIPCSLEMERGIWRSIRLAISVSSSCLSLAISSFWGCFVIVVLTSMLQPDSNCSGVDERVRVSSVALQVS